MMSDKSNKDHDLEEKYPSSYREVKIGKTLYCVTSVFMGEKELGPAMEKLAVRKVLDEMNAKERKILQNMKSH